MPAAPKATHAANFYDAMRSGRRKPRGPKRTEWKTVEAIQRMVSRYEHCTDEELVAETDWLRQRFVIDGGLVDEETTRIAFALVNESLFRSNGFRFYDVQLLAGIVLSQGQTAEMQTGEGKTVTAALPAFMYALRGEGVHVATVNSYLAERDYQELGPILERLGLSVGLLTDDAETEEKRTAYNCDVTYGTGYAFGFDYLRDQLVLRDRMTPQGRHRFRNVLRYGKNSRTQTMQRGLSATIVDELDSVFIDDAATPLILAGAAGDVATDAGIHEQALIVADSLVLDQDYQLDAVAARIEFTKTGESKVHDHDLGELSAELLRPWAGYVETALRARHLFRRDIHYVVDEDEILIVDQTTGRIHSERQWRGGLHQAIQVRESVSVRAETDTLARVTRQRFYQLYCQICGMTGTAIGGENELAELYGQQIIQIPTHRPSLRELKPAFGFGNADAKWEAIAHEVAEVHGTKRPVLVGTRTIAASELLAEKLTDLGIAFSLLNGKQDAEEAEIISAAGQSCAVTIATNMAGRGTDIRLSPAALEAGGLHVVATEYNESARVDRQLIGRSARQGDPGSARFFYSADDRLIEKFAPRLARRLRSAADSNGRVRADYTKQIAELQEEVEHDNFVKRRQMYEQDRVQNEILNIGRTSTAG